MQFNRRTRLAGWLMLAAAAVANAQDDDELPVPANLQEFEARLNEILDETNTPGLGITLVSRDGVIWKAGLGLADRQTETSATSETLFRIGSISKMFVALSVLQLVERGRLDLDAPIRDLVPDIEFENPWAETDPVRVVHLLEHTTGFDDLHLVEYASSDPTPLRLAEGLALHPHSRTVRWRPGTQFSYSNSGPAVAAYIVERITGQRFEDYVEQNIFDPLDMSTASYLLTDAVRESLATLYVGGRTPAPYWHISIRPAGSINASATDMAPFVRMLLNRGELDGTRIASADSIARMETATSTLGAAAGLEAGYGLANYSTVTDGFVFRGHNGGLAGGVADLGYLPEHGVGYALMLNSDSGVALQRIARVTRRFLTRDLEPPVLSEGRAVPEQVAEEFGGFYRLDTPRQELMRFLLRLRVGVVAIDGDRLRVGPIGGATSEYVAVSDRLARQTDQPITSLALIGDVDGRTRIQVGGTGFFKVPAWRAWAGTVASLSSVLLMLSAVAFALIWVPRRFFGKLKGKSGIGVRAWPLLTVLLLVASFSFLATAGPDPTELGRPTLASVGFSVATVLFLFAACFGLYVVWNARALPINRVAYWHSASVATANACVAGYLLYWGIIGVRLWSF